MAYQRDMTSHLSRVLGLTSVSYGSKCSIQGWGSLLDNAPNQVVGCIIQKRMLWERKYKNEPFYLTFNSSVLLWEVIPIASKRPFNVQGFFFKCGIGLCPCSFTPSQIPKASTQPYPCILFDVNCAVPPRFRHPFLTNRSPSDVTNLFKIA